MGVFANPSVVNVFSPVLWCWAKKKPTEMSHFMSFKMSLPQSKEGLCRCLLPLRIIRRQWFSRLMGGKRARGCKKVRGQNLVESCKQGNEGTLCNSHTHTLSSCQHLGGGGETTGWGRKKSTHRTCDDFSFNAILLPGDFFSLGLYRASQQRVPQPSCWSANAGEQQL